MVTEGIKASRQDEHRLAAWKAQRLLARLVIATSRKYVETIFNTRLLDDGYIDVCCQFQNGSFGGPRAKFRPGTKLIEIQ